MIEKKNINNSVLVYYSEPSIHIREYYNYCLKLIEEKLYNSDLNINLIFGNINVSLNNEKPYVRCDIQYEHTIVKNGGRGVDNKIFGGTNTDDGEKYLIRITNYNYYNNLDFVIEYSNPNIVNISSNESFDDFIKKVINISPLLHNIDFNPHGRNTILTLYDISNNIRRKNINDKMISSFRNFKNVQNIFDKKDINDLYSKTKILLNVHQTEHHHTFEELRVLPALCSGVIVVSEKVPLIEHIEYGDSIIWSDYEGLIDKVNEVEDNYEYYFKKVFNNTLKEKLLNIENNNKLKLNIIDKWKQNQN
jgi:hypothetical protein